GAGFRGGRRMGYGAAWNYMPYDPVQAMPETEIEILRQQSIDLEKNLELIKKRISEIEASGSADQDSGKKPS
ncbi:DUF5320 domain-containing protein, partial [bacterium]|nr:DUF5320 domain-containing protein [bacterium]